MYTQSAKSGSTAKGEHVADVLDLIDLSGIGADYTGPAPRPRPAPANRAAIISPPIPPDQRPPAILSPFSPPVKKLAATVRKVILQGASTYFFWQTAPDGSGPYLQNSERRPLPIQRSGINKAGQSFTTAQAATITVEKVYLHLFGGQQLFITNDPTRDVWHVAADIDRDIHGTAAGTFNAIIGQRGFVSPSRSTGQHCHFAVNVEGIDPTEARYRLEAVAEALRAKVVGLEALKGLPVIARNDAGKVLTPREIVDTAKNLFWTGSADTLDDVLNVNIPQHASLLFPCVNRPGRTFDKAAAHVNAYLEYRKTCRPISLRELEQLAGIGSTTRPTPPAPRPANHDTGPRSNHILEMVASDAKPTARAGAVFAALQQLGDVEEEAVIERANTIYSNSPAASDGELDRKRVNALKTTVRWALRSFDETLRGQCPLLDMLDEEMRGLCPLEALDGQTGGPGWFTPADIARAERQLSSKSTGLTHTTYRVMAVVFLTIRKNQYLAQCGGGSEHVRLFRADRARKIQLGIIRDRSTPGVDQPTRAIKGMLRYFGLRRCGAAVRESIEKLVEVGWIVCTDKSYQSSADGEGHARRYMVTEAGEAACHPDAAGASITSYSQRYGVQQTPNHTSQLQPNTSIIITSTADFAAFGGFTQAHPSILAENERITLN